MLRDDSRDALRVLDQLLNNDNYGHLFGVFRMVRARALRKSAHLHYKAPNISSVVGVLDKGNVASVEDLRAYFVECLKDLQESIYGSELDVRSLFFDGGKRVDEKIACRRIVNQLQARLESLEVTVEIEDEMADQKRCDITLQKNIEGRTVLLVVEVKGQWHDELYTAAAEQLEKRYMNHPNAEDQGVYLVLWFGEEEKVANKKNEEFESAVQLSRSVEESMSDDLRKRIDVVTIDFSRNNS